MDRNRRVREARRAYRPGHHDWRRRNGRRRRGGWRDRHWRARETSLMLNTPFPVWPAFSEEEADAVAGVIRSNRVSYWTGDQGRQFEREFAEWVGVSHAVALNNGTVALEV